MSKQDVKQAISETIVPNGKKAITGQSLANVLNMIVDEGGGGGSYLMIRHSGMSNETLILTEADKEHNRQIFETAKNAALNNEVCPPILIDLAPLLLGSGAALSASSLISMPMLYGYVSGAELVGELGYSEMAISFSLLVAQCMILPDGNVIFESSN